MASPHPVNVFLFGIKAIRRQISDRRRQQVAMRVQLFDIEVNASLFLVFTQQRFTRRSLRNGQGVSAVAGHINDGERRDFQAALGASGTTVEEVIQAISAFAALGNEGSILGGDQRMAGLSGFGIHLLIEQRTIEWAAKLASDGALTVVAIAAQVAKVAATSTSQNGRQ